MERAILLTILAGLLTVAGCASSSPKTPPTPTTRAAVQKPTIARNSDNGGTITLAPGGRLIVRLAANPTTGYTWKVAVLDAHYLQQMGEPVYESANPQIPGSGGTQSYTFTAKAPGSTAMVLDYVRPWEKQTDNVTSFTLNVVIREEE
jgi:inhibitor of cysteine peptidase